MLAVVVMAGVATAAAAVILPPFPASVSSLPGCRRKTAPGAAPCARIQAAGRALGERLGAIAKPSTRWAYFASHAE